MNTLEIREDREMFPKVRDISRYRRIPSIKVMETPHRKKVNLVTKVKWIGIMVFASFLLVTSVNEGVKTWLKHSGGNAEASGDFIVPRVYRQPVLMNQPLIARDRPADQVGMLREANRYRVDMARERNRFVSNLLGHAERVAGRLSR